MSAFRPSAIVCVLLAVTACGGSPPQPVTVSSAGLPGYALGYPDRLGAETQSLVAGKAQATELTEKFSTRSREFKAGADPGLLLLVVRQSDQAGRSEAFARTTAEARALGAFWEEERGPIAARANAAAQKQLTEANCGACGQADLNGPIAYALTNGVEKQLEKRLRACNEAHRTIEHNKDALGTGNLAIAQKLADDVAFASHRVHVALPEARDRIDTLLDERDDVESTIERALEWERSYQGGDRSAADKKESQARAAALEKTRAAIPAAVTQAEAARKDLDRQIEEMRKRYGAALEALENELEAAQEARAAK